MVDFDIGEFTLNNTKNYVCGSSTADRMSQEPCLVGIDEAGRGPVLGPMVYGICYSPISKQDKLKSMGFADSKVLSEDQRDRMFNALVKVPEDIGWFVNLLSPHYISTCMLRRVKYNLNELSHDTAIDLLRKVIERGVNVTEVYVDTVGDPMKYQNKLSALFPGINITVAKKADATYSICSAASICAKVLRDKAITEWKFTENVHSSTTEHGSGYPGDPKTKEFLVQNVDKIFGFPKIVRFSWATADKLLQEKAVSVRWIDDEEDGKTNKNKKRKALESFFDRDKENKKHEIRYFSERRLNSCLTL